MIPKTRPTFSECDWLFVSSFSGWLYVVLMSYLVTLTINSYNSWLYTWVAILIYGLSILSFSYQFYWSPCYSLLRADYKLTICFFIFSNSSKIWHDITYLCYLIILLWWDRLQGGRSARASVEACSVCSVAYISWDGLELRQRTKQP
jgi:hypothetical protein